MKLKRNLIIRYSTIGGVTLRKRKIGNNGSGLGVAISKRKVEEELNRMASIEQLQKINTPAHQVYLALTTKEGLSEIWTKDLEVEAVVGKVNEFRFGPNDTAKLKVIELIPDKRVSWECVDANTDPEWIGTTITFELTESNGTTKVDFCHAQWKEITSCYKFCNYNWAMFLLSLKQYCELGKGTPYQERTF
ncbi:SRPBCC domain-containing protein [Cytobacillus praedii]|uniref:SRPBCC family protein n=1 Tax=Cytobacillus praedii TaxID=1742358 RepID=UPI002E20D168|nr:SRPBCC domain-containing protein [Cytobacillus praedii]